MFSKGASLGSPPYQGETDGERVQVTSEKRPYGAYIPGQRFIYFTNQPNIKEGINKQKVLLLVF